MPRFLWWVVRAELACMRRAVPGRQVKIGYGVVPPQEMVMYLFSVHQFQGSGCLMKIDCKSDTLGR
nr:hypothetical protein XACG102_5930006 [Xanthomonas citri pv. citri]CEH77111.1 hypothetical protein XACS582_7460006 [Xanthomonas citri pv. citri]CEJ24098.1 hypothetical protein XACE116_6820005 [Xanthomonas citri pv. citri]CEJ30434.1 hypothetical protein XACE116_6820005 [Xanthomonas citri pv. citri]